MGFKRTENRSTRNDNRSNDDRPKTKVWMNIGYESIDEETGDPIFVSLPFGLGIDTMNKPDLPNGKNQAFLRLVESKIDFLEQLQAYAETFEPGQEEIIPDLKIQIRRIEEAAQDTSGEENPHRTALSQLSFVQRNSKAA